MANDFSCNECHKDFGTYYELREHKTASHKSLVDTGPKVERFK